MHYVVKVCIKQLNTTMGTQPQEGLMRSLHSWLLRSAARKQREKAALLSALC